jgi:hypothetical protein
MHTFTTHPVFIAHPISACSEADLGNQFDTQLHDTWPAIHAALHPSRIPCSCKTVREEMQSQISRIASQICRHNEMDCYGRNNYKFKVLIGVSKRLNLQVPVHVRSNRRVLPPTSVTTD